MAYFREKRAGSRRSHKVPATIEEVNDNFLYRARMVNYSPDGMCLETDVVLDPQSEIIIGIEESPYENAALSADASACFRGKIIWQKDIRGGIFNFGYGVKIVSDDNQQSAKGHFSQQRPESRRHPRKSFAKPVVFISDNRHHKGVTKNISRRGAFIEVEDKLDVGQIIKLAIPGTKIDNGVMLKGQVVHLGPMGIGVNFKSLIKKKQIIQDRGGTRSGADRRKLFFSQYTPEKRSGQERRSGGDRRSLEHIKSRKAFDLSKAFRNIK
jgi:hypothetical protein